MLFFRWSAWQAFCALTRTSSWKTGTACGWWCTSKMTVSVLVFFKVDWIINSLPPLPGLHHDASAMCMNTGIKTSKTISSYSSNSDIFLYKNFRRTHGYFRRRIGRVWRNKFLINWIFHMKKDFFPMQDRGRAILIIFQSRGVFVIFSLAADVWW